MPAQPLANASLPNSQLVTNISTNNLTRIYIDWCHPVTLAMGVSHLWFSIGIFLTERSHTIVNTIVVPHSEQSWLRMSATRPPSMSPVAAFLVPSSICME